jgi:O-antigen/teichoic acid export membrane protein
MQKWAIDRGRTWWPTPGPLLRRFLGVFGVDALLRASGMIFLPVYLHLMSQDAYASFSYITSLIGVLSLVCNFGLYVAQSKLLHEFPAERHNDVVFTINLLLIVLLSATLLPLYLFGWDREVIRLLFSGTVHYEDYRYLIPVGVLLAVYAQMQLNYFMTREQIRNTQRFNIARLALGLTLTIGALRLFSGDGATIRIGASFVAEIVVIAAFFSHYASTLRGRFSTEVARKSLSLGLPIMASALLGVVVNFGDKFFIERYCNLADMSVYFLALTLSGAVSLVAMSFHSVWLPSFLKEPDLRVNLQRTWHAGRTLLVALALLCVAIWFTVAACIHLGVFRQSYADVLTLLPILLASALATSITGLLSAYTIYWNMTYVTVITGALVAVVSVPLNYFAVKAHGVYGIAVTALLMNLLFALLYLAFVHYRAKLQLAKS